MTFLPAHVRAVEFVYGKVVEMLVPVAEVLSNFSSQVVIVDQYQKHYQC